MFVVSALLEFAFVVLLNRLPNPIGRKLYNGALDKGADFDAARLRRNKITIKEYSSFDELETETKPKDQISRKII